VPEIKQDIRGVTFVVAANDSLHKNMADFVCDGVGDQVEIQAAIDALPATGGLIVLLDGTFVPSALVTIDQSNVKIIGKGAIISPSADISGFFTIEADNIEISGITFSYLDVALTAGSYVILGDTVAYTYNVDIHDNSFYARTISGNPVPNALNDATMVKTIETGSGVGWRIHDNYAEIGGNEFVSASALTTGVGDLKPSRTIISNNIIVNYWSGLVLEGGNTYSVIDGNTITGTQSVNIHLWHEDTQHNIVSNNVCQGGDYGVYADGAFPSFNNKVIGNTFVNVGSGLKADGSKQWTVQGNTFISDGRVGAGNEGIRITDSDIISNSVYGFYRGIVGNGRIIGNTVYCSTDTGFVMNGAQVFANNRVYNTNYAIWQNLVTIPEIIQGNTINDADVLATTIVGNPLAGATEIEVTSALGFRYAEFITTSPATFPVEDNRIVYVDYLANIITLAVALGNNHTAGDAVAIRDTSSIGFFQIGAGVKLVNNIVESIPSPVWACAETTIMYNSYCDIFMDVLAVSANHVRNNEDLSAGIPITFTRDAQPDVPRTLSGHFDAHANITAYIITVEGRDAQGKSIEEVFTEADGWDWETNNAYSVISAITMTARTGTGVGDTMDIGITDVLGLTNVIYETGDVYKIHKNNAHAGIHGARVDVDYNTYDMAVIGLAATDDFTIWYRSALNRIY